MEIQNKQEPQQISFNHLPNIGLKNFTNFYKNCTQKPSSFLVIDATPASNNPSCFRKNLLER